VGAQRCPGLVCPWKATSGSSRPACTASHRIKNSGRRTDCVVMTIAAANVTKSCGALAALARQHRHGAGVVKAMRL